MDISQESIKNATHCTKKNSCLEDPGKLCRVVSYASPELMFVYNKENPTCPYYTNFGYGGFCNCPVRKEIYNKYSI
jgi:hypothetical protein